jgi:structural toxin protein (hemagglutinin/hemolysin) RtxA
MYKLCFYVPKSQCEIVKKAIFKANAGQLGNYKFCCWQTLGIGQFMPQQGAKPSMGKIGELKVVEEYKVEMLCTEQYIKAAVSALLKSHPYEHVAYDVIAVTDATNSAK